MCNCVHMCCVCEYVCIDNSISNHQKIQFVHCICAVEWKLANNNSMDFFSASFISRSDTNFQQLFWFLDVRKNLKYVALKSVEICCMQAHFKRKCNAAYVYVKSESFTNKLKVACKLKIANNSRKNIVIICLHNMYTYRIYWLGRERERKKQKRKKTIQKIYSRDEKQKWTKNNIPVGKKIDNIIEIKKNWCQKLKFDASERIIRIEI